MKVLWVSLVKFPPLCQHLGVEIPANCGWLYSSAKALLNEMPDVELGVIVYSYGRNYEEYSVDGISYYMIPTSNMSKTSRKQINGCSKAIKAFAPDLIHLHGTEHSLAEAVCIANIKNIKTVANIQGLADPYTRYADGGLSFWDKFTNITLLDFYRKTFIFNQKNSFKHRAKCENAVLRNITDVVGRTQWDHDHVVTVNPNLIYHILNETLRDSFYESPKWSYESCQKHTIFVSNSGSPLKGAHQVLRAMPIILKYFPDAKVVFCGSSVMNSDFNSILRRQGYHLYLRKLVKHLKLENNVSFVGSLSETQMKQAFLDANVYVMPSMIENSPNSLCEAQILGVPVVASYCGGTPSLLVEGETGFFYRYEEYEMLAQIIMRLFNETEFFKLSRQECNVAEERHNKNKNATILKLIYNNIVNNVT